MSVIYIALPVTALLAISAVWAFIAFVKRGEYDDLDTPPVRMLHDDLPSNLRK
ncbi:MAG: cbb3-type cytochrome oxidase assembly protein [Planctomycetota bacterium]|nr:cbb3-type cytochrome oxidase assembly protein [Planctomycetota bacterium]